MARTLLLVRHGKAEKAQPGLADIDRSLVPGAAEALGESFSRVSALLEAPASPVLIWTSPALRARQTAQELAGALAGRGLCTEGPEELDCLLYQDAEGFFARLAQTADDACVAAVGHIPFMEDVLECLCSDAISFAPGSVAALSLPAEPLGETATEGRPAARAAAPAGTLLWFVRGAKVR